MTVRLLDPGQAPRMTLAYAIAAGQEADLVVELEHFLPFENGEVIYDEHLIGLFHDPEVSASYSIEGRRYEGPFRAGQAIVSPAGKPERWRLDTATDATVVPTRRSTAASCSATCRTTTR